MFMSNPMFGGDAPAQGAYDSDDSASSGGDGAGEFIVPHVSTGEPGGIEVGEQRPGGVLSPTTEQRLRRLEGTAEDEAIQTARLVRTESYRARRNPLRSAMRGGARGGSGGRTRGRGKHRFSPARRGHE